MSDNSAFAVFGQTTRCYIVILLLYRDNFIFVFLPIVKKEVDDYCVDYNLHSIRKQKAVTIPTGASPEDMYNHPDMYGENTLFF